MIKQTIFLILSALVFTACVESGKTLQPRINTKDVVKSEKSIETNTTNTVKAMDTNNTETTDIETIDFSFLNLTNETKNRLSGVAIILIGLMILL